MTINLTTDQVWLIKSLLDDQIRGLEYTVNKYDGKTREEIVNTGHSYHKYLHDDIEGTKARLAFTKRTREAFLLKNLVKA